MSRSATLDAGEDDEVEVVSFTVAGPSRHLPGAKANRRSARPTRSKAPFIAREIIEITDSDTEDGGEGSRANDAGMSGQAEPLLGRGPHGEQEKAPLFLPDPEDESDEDVYAILDGPDVEPLDVPFPEHGPWDWPEFGPDRDLPAAPPPVEHEPEDHPPPDGDLEQPPVADEDDDRIVRLCTGVLAIVPDVDPTYLRDLATRQLAADDPGNGGNADGASIDDRLLATLVNHILEDPNYPKRGPGMNAVHPPRPPSSKSPTPSSSATSKRREVSTGPSSSGCAAEKPEGRPQPQGSMHASKPSSKGKDRESRAESHAKEEMDPISRLVAQVLEIVPDAEPDHVLKLVQTQLAVTVDLKEDESGGEDPTSTLWERVSGAVLHNLFENPDYPKASKKRKRSETEDESKAAKARKLDEVNYGDKGRVSKKGKHYNGLALAQLVKDFPSINHSALQTCFLENNSLYAPTFLALQQHPRGVASQPADGASNADEGGTKKSSSKKKGKGKEVQRSDAEFEAERAWLVRKLQEDAAALDGPSAADDDVADGEGFECGCCFTEYPFRKMTQCPEGHLFCTTCVTSYASTLLGEQNHQIACMDQSGCKLLFSSTELRRFLPTKLLELYERICQRKELEAAGLEGLEECPFCEYQVVIENEHEKLFRCERPDCGAVTCRKCKKMDHLPKSCEENESDKKLDARHHVEEAMTRALMRNCPKCNKAFIKESGCNKMVCPNCRTMSCYICRKIIHGYDHFNNPPPYKGPVDSKKCQLWDAVEQRHADEVTAAAKKAQEEYKLLHPEINEADVEVDLPKQAADASSNPRVPQPIPAAQIVPLGHHHHPHYGLPGVHFPARHIPPVEQPRLGLPPGVYAPPVPVGFFRDVPVPAVHHPVPVPPLQVPHHALPHAQFAAMVAHAHRIAHPPAPVPPPMLAAVAPPVAAAARVRRRVALPTAAELPQLQRRHTRAQARAAAVAVPPAPAPAPAPVPVPAPAPAPVAAPVDAPAAAPGRAAARNMRQREREMLQRVIASRKELKVQALLQAERRGR